MLRLLGVRFAFVVGVGASLLAFVREAVACTPPPAGWFSYGSFEVPQNGVVPVQYLCYVNCESPPDPETFALSDGAGSAASGSIVLTGGGLTQRYLVWKPDAELALGSYTAALPGVSFATSYEVVPAISFSTITPVASINPIDRNDGDEVCCSGPVDSCGGRPCFPTEIARSAGLSVDFSTGSVVEDGQYAHRFVPEDDSSEPIWTYSGALAGYELEEEATSTCYTLELLRLVDGVVERFEERCIDGPETLVPGLHPNAPENIDLVLSRCEAAPDGFDEEWCDVHAERCSAPAAPFCEHYAATCSSVGGASGSGGDTGSGGSAGSEATGGTSTGGTPTGGRAGRGGSGGTGGDAGAAGEDNAGEDEEKTVRTEACGCTLPGKSAPVGSLAALLALALGSLAARRRTRT